MTWVDAVKTIQAWCLSIVLVALIIAAVRNSNRLP